jgi:hypothetical protein
VARPTLAAAARRLAVVAGHVPVEPAALSVPVEPVAVPPDRFP